MIAADLVVVGDGVAGCAAAISASRLGLATVVVRSATTPRAVDLPETLTPSAVPLLRKLGIGAETIQDAFPAITTRISRWGTGPVVDDAMLPRANASLLLGKQRLRSLLWSHVLDTAIPTINVRISWGSPSAKAHSSTCWRIAASTLPGRPA
jgi:2-polyprenyl-6-methoxyphenol hydroxylase-like FAD-dependent oxidoreductase